MQNQDLIAVEEICIHHNIEASFIYNLQKTGLIEVITLHESLYIQHDQLSQLEKYIAFHYTLEINMEGIETISHLLLQIDGLQAEVNTLKNRLLFYESEIRHS